MTTTNKHRPINVSPFATNVLDLAGRPGLQTPDGRAIYVSRSMGGFVVKVDGEREFSTDDNIVASRYLNSFEVGTFS